MSPLIILKVVNPKGHDPNEEYVLLKASQDLTLRHYALVDRTFDEEGGVSNEFRHIFVFPDHLVSTGDFVRVYTGKSDEEIVKNQAGTYTHKLYWGSSQCIWNNRGGDRATLIEYQVRDSEPVPPAK